MNKTVSTGLKIWLGFIMIIKVIILLEDLGNMATAPLRSGLFLLLDAGMIAACERIWVDKKKMGLFLMIGIQSANFIVYEIRAFLNGKYLGLAGRFILYIVLIHMIISTIYPLVTWLFMRKKWDEFQ